MVPMSKKCVSQTGRREDSSTGRRPLPGLLLAALITLLLTIAGCSFDIAPVNESEVRNCLNSKGERPVELDPERQGVPAAHRRLFKEDGFEGSLAVPGKRRGQHQAWAYLFFFDGSERAEDVYEALKKSIDGDSVHLATTRRQNVIVIYGKPGTFGSAKTESNSRDLDSCFDQAIE